MPLILLGIVLIVSGLYPILKPAPWWFTGLGPNPSSVPRKIRGVLTIALGVLIILSGLQQLFL
ncbi:hypothetical protein [Paenibacillus pini]|uniref:Uncharacterized protein n=1 Tax=Paenibacillus pini JCM 16418 TaxID=1236976 RepID=W7YSG9_9BACL|nr:hypothetical protein [Paenibacillus pini]GAF07566.1 hypothetical protein JCM16418_1587 [Paenibacillus pini JCM 16418]